MVSDKLSQIYKLTIPAQLFCYTFVCCFIWNQIFMINIIISDIKKPSIVDLFTLKSVKEEFLTLQLHTVNSVYKNSIIMNSWL